MRQMQEWVLGLRHQRDRLLEALASAGLAMTALWWLSAPNADEIERLALEVDTLKQQQEPGFVAARPQSLWPAGFKPQQWPLQTDSVALWTAVQDSLEACGLQVQALQPQASDHREGLPEQTVALRLSGA